LKAHVIPELTELEDLMDKRVDLVKKLGFYTDLNAKIADRSLL